MRESELVDRLRNPNTPDIYSTDVQAMRWAAECIERKYGTEECEGCHDRDEEIDALREALRMAADEPNIDKARAIADAVLGLNVEVTGGALAARPVD